MSAPPKSPPTASTFVAPALPARAALDAVPEAPAATAPPTTPETPAQTFARAADPRTSLFAAWRRLFVEDAKFKSFIGRLPAA